MYSDKVIATVGVFTAIICLFVLAIGINIWAQWYFGIENPGEFWKIWTIGTSPQQSQQPQPQPPPEEKA